MAKVKDIAMQIRGVSYHPEDLHDNLDEDSVVLLRANNIKDGKLILDDVVYVSKSKVAEQQYLQTDDILICASSGSKELVGKAAFVDSVKNPMTFGAFCKVVRPQPEYSEYLGHYFNSPVYRRKISALSAGANINNIKNEHIDNLDIQLVDEKERQEIITILNKLNMLISLRKQQLAKLDELVKARFVEMFGDPVSNPKHWKTAFLLDIGYCKNGMNFHKGDSGVDIHCLGVGDFKNRTMIQNVEDLPFVSLNELPDPEYLLRDNDIIFVRSNGNKELVGRCLAIYPGSIPVTYSGFCIRYRLTSTNIDTPYLLHVLKTDSIRKKMTGRGANIQNLNQQTLSQLLVPIPPLSLQNEFAAFVERVDQQKQTIQQSLEKLELMKKVLMQEYFG